MIHSKEFEKEWYEEGDEDSNKFERNTISEIQREKEFDGNSCCVVMGVNEFVDGANGSEGNLVLKSNFWLLVDEYERNMLKVNKKSDTVYAPPHTVKEAIEKESTFDHLMFNTWKWVEKEKERSNYEAGCSFANSRDYYDGGITMDCNVVSISTNSINKAINKVMLIRVIVVFRRMEFYMITAEVHKINGIGFADVNKPLKWVLKNVKFAKGDLRLEKNMNHVKKDNPGCYWRVTRCIFH
ncbi:hypothetical protein Tco_1157515 [Tanacetum coccineum]